MPVIPQVLVMWAVKMVLKSANGAARKQADKQSMHGVGVFNVTIKL